MKNSHLPTHHFNKIAILAPIAVTLALAAPVAYAQTRYECFSGVVTTPVGNRVTGATVTINGIQNDTSTQKTTATNNGIFSVCGVRSAPGYRITIKKPGFALSTKMLMSPGGVKNLKIILPRGTTQTINPTQSVTIADSITQIKLPGNAFVDENGLAANEPIQATVLTYDQPNTVPMPGNMTAEGGGFLLTAGAFFAEFFGATTGKKYNLAPGVKAEVSIPSTIGNDPTGLFLWSYDEVTGLWKKEGEQVQKIGSRYVGKVSHFSAWNFDWVTQDSACVGFQVHESFFEAHKKYDNDGNDYILTIRVRASKGNNTPAVFYDIKIKSEDVFENNGTRHAIGAIAPYATVTFFIDKTGSNPPVYGNVNDYAAVSSGAAWGGPYTYPYTPGEPYTQCNGQVVLQ